MSRIRIIKGKLTEIIGGDYNIYSASSIVDNAAGEIIEVGVEKGVSYGIARHPPAPEIKAKCIVHFRPKNNWRGEDYGFDWMRLGETSNFGDVNYKDIVAKQYTDSTFTTLERDVNAYNGSFRRSPTLYTRLRQVYGVYDIPWRQNEDGIPENYFCSWLSLYPSWIRDGEGNLEVSNFKNTKAVLSLILEIEEPPERLRFKENRFFNISPMEITPRERGKHELRDFVTIECLEEFSTDQEIEVEAITRNSEGEEVSEVAGRLKVWANHAPKQKKKEVVFVKIKTPEIKVGTGEREPSVVDEKDRINQYLRQAYIRLSDTSDIVVLDLTTDNEFVDFITNEKIDSNKTSGGKTLHDYLKVKLEAAYPQKYQKHFKAFYFAEDGYHRSGGYISGYSQRGADYVVVFKSKNNQTAAHEFLHSLDLPHSFTNSEADAKAEFTYQYATTENIMDYSHLIYQPRYSLWKWQWVIANSSV